MKNGTKTPFVSLFAMSLFLTSWTFYPLYQSRVFRCSVSIKMREKHAAITNTISVHSELVSVEDVSFVFINLSLLFYHSFIFQLLYSWRNALINCQLKIRYENIKVS